MERLSARAVKGLKRKDPTNKPIDPFLAAPERISVDASIGAHDGQVLRPDWDADQVSVFIDQHAAVIARAMLTAGVEAVRQLASPCKTRPPRTD